MLPPPQAAVRSCPRSLKPFDSCGCVVMRSSHMRRLRPSWLVLFVESSDTVEPANPRGPHPEEARSAVSKDGPTCCGPWPSFETPAAPAPQNEVCEGSKANSDTQSYPALAPIFVSVPAISRAMLLRWLTKV